MKCSSACRFPSRVTWFSKCLNCSPLTSIDCGSMTLTTQVMSLPTAPWELCPVAQCYLSSCSFKMFFPIFDADHRQTDSESQNCQSPLKKQSYFFSLSLVLVFQQDWIGFIILLTLPLPSTATGRQAQIIS